MDRLLPFYITGGFITLNGCLKILCGLIFNGLWLVATFAPLLFLVHYIFF